MNDLINLLRFPQLNYTLENLPPLQLEEIPPELLQQLKNGDIINLKIISAKDGAIKSFIDFEGHLTEVVLKNISSQSFLNEPELEFKVRLGASGQLFPLRNQKSSETMNAIENTTTTNTNKEQNIFKNIELSDIKPSKIISKLLSEKNIPETAIKEIAQKLNSLQPNILKSGYDIQLDKNIVKSLQNIIQNKDIKVLANEINNFFNELEGKQINGQISERNQEFTTVKTLLGETFFTSKLKLPLAEKIILNIEKIIPNKESSNRFLSELLSDTKTIQQSPSGKLISERMQNLNAATLNIIKPHFAFQGKDIFSDIFNFYQSAITKDLSLWIGKKQIDKITTAGSDGNRQLQELNNFLLNSVKENAIWKIVEMPMFDGSLFSSLKIAVKKDSSSSKTQKKKTGTRFVVETEFSKLGKFQFDGYSVAEKRKLDLIIRTSKNISDDFCKHIINLFKKTLYDVNYSGSVKINQQDNFIPLHSTTEKHEGFYI